MTETTPAQGGSPKAGIGRMGASLYRALLFAALWWVLAEGRLEAWWLGAAGVAAATWTSLRFVPPGPYGIRVVPLLRFLAVFVWNSLRGGMQVALFALRPRPDLAPQLLVLPLRLPPGAPRVLMTTAIGLMPGTLGVCLDGDRLRLHVLDASLPAAAEAEALQSRIARIFAE